MDHVVAHGSAGRGAQGVDAAHVAHHAPAEVMDMVELDGVVMGFAGGVTPSPTDGDAGVGQIGDVVVRDLVVGAVSDPDADGAAVETSAAADDVVIDDAMSGGVGALRIFVVPALADVNSAAGHVVNQASLDAAVLAAAAEPNGMAADVGDLAVDDRHVPSRRRP